MKSIRERLVRLESRWKGLKQLQKAAKEAIQLALEDLNRRLSEMNELRRQIDGERGTYVRREWFDQVHHTLEERVKTLELTVTATRGRDEPVVALGKWIAGILMLVIVGIIAHFLWK
jgi:hypothetical protein